MNFKHKHIKDITNINKGKRYSWDVLIKATSNTKSKYVSCHDTTYKRLKLEYMHEVDTCYRDSIGDVVVDKSSSIIIGCLQ